MMPRLLRFGDQLLHGIDRAQRVAHVADGKDARAIGEGRKLQVQFPVVRDRDHLQHGAMPLAGQLPWDDVGVVLHAGDQHFIPLLQERSPQAACGEVEAGRGAAGEDHLVRVLGVDVLADRFACGFLRLGGLGAQRCTPRCTLALIVA
jgi:hypothetical protein